MAHGYPDYEGNKAGLYLQQAWAAEEGLEKNFHALADDQELGDSLDETYTVPAGKRLYILWAGAKSIPKTALDAEELLYCVITLYNGTDVLAGTGGIGGAQLILPAPQVIEAGETMHLIAGNAGHATVSLVITGWGYEVDV